MFESWRFKTDALAQLRGHRLLPLLLIALVLFVQYFIPFPRAPVPEIVENGLHWSYGLDWDLGMEQVQSFVTDNLNRQTFIRGLIKVVSMLIIAAMNIALFRFFLFFSFDSSTTKFNTFLEGLNYWWKSILASVYVNVRIFLWSLLMLPAGIVLALLANVVGKGVILAILPVACSLLAVLLVWKSLQYSQFFFILAEYPHVGISKALKTSIVITRGYCGKLFGFFLGFIGWAILSCITMGIGFLFLFPYIYTAWGNAYRFLKNNAFEQGHLVKKGADNG
jgi:uncharacterized membrane protein